MSHLITYFYQFDFTNILQQKRNRKNPPFLAKIGKIPLLVGEIWHVSWVKKHPNLHLSWLKSSFLGLNMVKP